ncbi:MAG: peptidyl-prolyl cis-trans isomerase [Desulfobacterales bacterium]|nr:peptidyl-prolyl cis-trans isomerase [Desulfobacterales bacterium]
MKALVREPLLHFLLIGALLFTAFGFRQNDNSGAENRILVSRGQIDQLSAQFKRTRLRLPTEPELAGLTEAYVRDEVYYREARAMGLDQDDPVVRQRMRLKLEFLLEDLASQATPDDVQLTEFMQRHPNRFREDARLSFTQVYLNPDERTDLAADTVAILGRLNQGASPDAEGDRTLIKSQYRLVDQFEISRVFGEEFAQQLVALEPGDWTGPLTSGYGSHLVRISAKQPARFPELSAIRAQVKQEYLAEQRQDLKDMTYLKLREGYEIVIETGLSQMTQ